MNDNRQPCAACYGPLGSDVPHYARLCRPSALGPAAPWLSALGRPVVPSGPGLSALGVIANMGPLTYV